MGAQALIDAMQVVKHDVRLAHLAQKAKHLDQLFAWHPEYWHAGAGRLDDEGFGAEARVQFDDDILVVSLVRRNIQSAVCSHDFGRSRSTWGREGALQSNARQSHVVGAAQVGNLDALFASLFFL